jgi:hypothetical protein
MVQPHHHNPNIISVEEERRREEVWRTATNEVIGIATERYHQLARLLGLGPQSAKAFVGAAMEATRQYQTGYMYANYEKRTGHPYPDEGHENEDKVWAQAWDMALARLQSTLGK